jgi:hypothetical protein
MKTPRSLSEGRALVLLAGAGLFTALCVGLLLNVIWATEDIIRWIGGR